MKKLFLCRKLIGKKIKHRNHGINRRPKEEPIKLNQKLHNFVNKIWADLKRNEDRSQCFIKNKKTVIIEKKSGKNIFFNLTSDNSSEIIFGCFNPKLQQNPFIRRYSFDEGSEKIILGEVKNFFND